MASCTVLTAGINAFLTRSAAAICMAVGNVSFDDCDMFTSSLGWIGFFDPISPPAISIARLEITSFTFILVCVPLPVCQMRSGN
jgi:peptide methionine sulfoxide reductase MsrB